MCVCHWQSTICILAQHSNFNTNSDKMLKVCVGFQRFEANSLVQRVQETGPHRRPHSHSIHILSRLLSSPQFYSKLLLALLCTCIHTSVYIRIRCATLLPSPKDHATRLYRIQTTSTYCWMSLDSCRRKSAKIQSRLPWRHRSLCMSLRVWLHADAFGRGLFIC